MVQRRLSTALSTATILGLVIGLVGAPLEASAQVGEAAAVAVTADVPDGSTPTITGDPLANATLYAQPGTWPEGTQLTYQWYSGGQPVEGAVERYYNPRYDGDLGARLHVVVTGVLPGGDVESRASAPTLRVAAAPTPEITGLLRVGATLTAVTRWTAEYALSYQWRVSGKPYEGATAATFVVPDDAEGARISVRVTGTAPDYPRATSFSQETLRVIRVGTVSIQGDAVVGATLVGVPGTWSAPIKPYLEWFADRKIVGGGETLVVTEAMRGKTISFSASGGIAGGTRQYVSARSAPVIGPGVPTVVGPAAVGRPLTADPGVWAEGTRLSYQWTVDGADISGETAATFLPSAATSDRRVAIRVTGALAGRTTLVATSSPTSPVLVAPTPKISGKHVVGSTLRAIPGSWTPGTKLSYQWFVGDMWMTGATAATYRLDERAIDLPVRVEVTGVKPGYDEVTVSASTPRAVYIPPVEFWGDFITTGSLAVDTEGWRKGTKVSYQWLRDGKPISKATNWWFHLRRSDLGHHVTARVTAVVPGYGTVVQVTPTKGKVGRATRPRIHGTAAVGSTLGFSMAKWMKGTRFSYRWFADEHPIAGAHGKTLVLTRALAGKRIHVEVTGRTPGYAVATTAASQTAKVR
ncbi:hypothetical protein [Microbacterium terricola]|uniref:Uncharacterized protein n=1 Tax=Microbacterium terricola TaxID=344163 RepID=A0ABM8E2B4_9MICO|nr:hypothetical protein [Microbacterium terricola]UYK40186.1 hypothetical protein OAU46_00620 [Microbacterium terricola]BDV32108.1 hypothetical protein Microterr_27680 [Microbacterium terricola]